jgi:predicted nucleic acid-binding protein
VKPVVLDCSAVVPWLLPEEPRPGTMELFQHLAQGRVLGVAPALLRTEFASAAIKKVRRGQCDFDTALGQFQRFVELPIHYESSPNLERGALTLASEQGIAVYDACYLWLAINVRCALATADDRLIEVAAKLGVELAI